MGLLDFLKKKKDEKKSETPALAVNTPTTETPAAETPADSLPPETAEEIAEKIMILIPYIKQYRSQGMLDEEIEAFLIEHSWPEYIVKRAIKNA